MNSENSNAKKILIVDDNGDTTELLQLVLARPDRVIHVAGGVKQALAIAAEQAIDLVISDIGLPDGTGFELMRAMTSTGRARGIALSGRARPEDIDESRRAGFDAHLTKPVSLDVLEETVARLLV